MHILIFSEKSKMEVPLFSQHGNSGEFLVEMIVTTWKQES